MKFCKSAVIFNHLNHELPQTHKQPLKEKATIPKSTPFLPAPRPDAERLVEALNQGDIHSFAPRLATSVMTVSEDTKQMIHGKTQTLNFFNARLDSLSSDDPGNLVAVSGVMDQGPATGDHDRYPCAILYDGFHKCCVFQIGIGDNQLVERILLSAKEATLRCAWPSEPPVFRHMAIMPSLAAP